jgi:hypothetical protein
MLPVVVLAFPLELLVRVVLEAVVLEAWVVLMDLVQQHMVQAEVVVVALPQTSQVLLVAQVIRV